MRGRVCRVRRRDADVRRLLVRAVHADLLRDRGDRPARALARRMRTELAPDAGAMARGAGVNVGGGRAATAPSFALSLLITHQITPRAFGLYSIAVVTVLLGQVPATLGLDVGAVRFVALRA